MRGERLSIARRVRSLSVPIVATVPRNAKKKEEMTMSEWVKCEICGRPEIDFCTCKKEEKA